MACTLQNLKKLKRLITCIYKKVQCSIKYKLNVFQKIYLTVNLFVFALLSLQTNFEYFQSDYEKQLVQLTTCQEKSGLIIHNPEQSVFLFIDKHQIQVRDKIYSCPRPERFAGASSDWIIRLFVYCLFICNSIPTTYFKSAIFKVWWCCSNQT